MEKIKNILLFALVILSIGLTYRLWFGFPLGENTEELPTRPLEVAVEAPPAEAIFQPSLIIFQDAENNLAYWAPGKNNAGDFWLALWPLLSEELIQEAFPAVIPEEEIASTGEEALVIEFTYPLPLELILNTDHRLYNREAQKILLNLSNQGLYLFTSGEEIYYFPLTPRNGLLLSEIKDDINIAEKTIPAKYLRGEVLPLVNILEGQAVEEQAVEEQEQPEEAQPEEAQLEEEQPQDEQPEEAQQAAEEQEQPEEAQPEETQLEDEQPQDEQDEEDDLARERQDEGFYLVAPESILVPVETPSIPGLLLKPEELDKEKLLESFFWDETLARRIEERDDAVFFSDGEKGFRFYEKGGLEFVAPLLERSVSTISRGSALLRGIEYISFYGGLPEEARLVGVESLAGGYLLRWKLHFLGLPLESEHLTLETLVNEGGMARYTRRLTSLAGEITAHNSTAGYEEALIRALQIYQEKQGGALLDREENVVLKDIYLCYYLEDLEDEARVFPSWAVELENNFKIYLDSRTLELVGEA